MKLLGIDYGTKRVGIATADTDAGMAFPKLVVKNDAELIKTIKDFCEKERVEKIVLGESKDLEGNDNLISEAIKEFKIVLENETNLTVIYEPEFYTSIQAARLQGENDMIDASAATIILQSYMDKFKG
jgi:putative Holliday junction resolvase